MCIPKNRGNNNADRDDVDFAYQLQPENQNLTYRVALKI